MVKAKRTGGKSLNLRNFPNDLYWLCKARAAQNQMRLQDYVVQVLRQAVSENADKAK
jgi:hypothetical protein